MNTGIVASTGAETFGTISVAMVTPFDQEGNLDIKAAVSLAAHLVEQGCDSLVLSGTTGESPVTSVTEKLELITAVRREVGDDVRLVAGSGTNNTKSTIELSQRSADAGADGLLVVTPYYSKPCQEGVFRHFTAVADAVDIPICLYDIPSRSVIPIESETIRRLAEHPRITAVKDAKGNMYEGSKLMAETGMAWYSGDDPLNLPWLSVGATGFISVIGHVAAAQLKKLRDAVNSGDFSTAREISVSLSPLITASGRLGGVSFAKAALQLQGHNVGEPRLPNISPNNEQMKQLADDMRAAGVL